MQGEVFGRKDCSNRWDVEQRKEDRKLSSGAGGSGGGGGGKSNGGGSEVLRLWSPQNGEPKTF